MLYAKLLTNVQIIYIENVTAVAEFPYFTKVHFVFNVFRGNKTLFIIYITFLCNGEDIL